MDARVRLTGDRPNIRALRQLGYDLEDAREVFREMAVRGTALLRRSTPVDTGRLAGTIRAASYGNRASVTVGHRNRAGYASPLEYGRWSRHRRFARSIDPEWESTSRLMFERYLRSRASRHGL